MVRSSDLEVGEVGDGVGLAGGQLGVEDQHPGVDLHGPHQDVLQLAPADQVLGIGLGPALLDHVADHDARRSGTARAARPPGSPSTPGRRAWPACRGSPTTTSSARSAPAGGDGGGDRALELLLERGDQLGGVDLGLVKRDRGQHRPGRRRWRWRAAGGPRADRPGARPGSPPPRPPDPGAAAPGRPGRRGSAPRCAGGCAPGAGRGSGPGRRAGGRTRARRCGRRPPRTRARCRPRRLASTPTCRSSSRDRPHM